MTVKDLIDYLENFPLDAEVVRCTGEETKTDHDYPGFVALDAIDLAYTAEEGS
jgi:hypothetical protein